TAQRPTDPASTPAPPELLMARTGGTPTLAAVVSVRHAVVLSRRPCCSARPWSVDAGAVGVGGRRTPAVFRVSTGCRCGFSGDLPYVVRTPKRSGGGLCAGHASGSLLRRPVGGCRATIEAPLRGTSTRERPL